ncbi:MAG: type II secretion system protein [Vulcanimicrobiota bacterium]
MSRPGTGGTNRTAIAGFNLIELMLALTLIAIAALTLVALSFTAVASREKAESISDAMLVAEEQLALAVYSIETIPEADHDAFWDNSLTAPFSEGSARIGPTDYNFRVEATDVPTGTLAPNRLRKLDITVWWWSENPGEGRVGSGQLSYSASRLVREIRNAPI